MQLLESPWGVRWSSLAMLAAILVVVTLARRRPLLALAAAMGWLVSFEVIYEATDIAVHHRLDAHLTSWGFWLLTVAGWPFFAHALGIRPNLRWVFLSAAIFALWIQQGFWYNWPGQPGPVQWEYELLNVGSKTALGVAYLLGALSPAKLEDLHGIAEYVAGLRRSVHGTFQLTRVRAWRQVGDEDPAGAGLSEVRQDAEVQVP